MKKIYGLLWLMLLTSQAIYCGFTFFDESSAIVVRGAGIFQNFGSPAQSNITTGKLQLAMSTNLTGSPIFFDQGTYSDGIFNVVMTSTYDPNHTFSIQMVSPSKLRFSTIGNMYEQVEVRGSNNRIEGLPFFVTPKAIQLKGKTAVVTMDLQSQLNQSIVLASDVSLAADLALGDGIIITGSGSIFYNGFNLITGHKDLLWTDTLTMVNGKNLELNGDSKLRGQWIFKGDGNIVGNTFTLDLTNGGTIRVRSGSTLRLTNVIIKGLGTGTILLDDLTSKLQLFNVVFDMDKNVTYTTGIWDAIGPVTVVTRDHFLTFDQRGTLTVDRTTVFYDPLSFNDLNNIQFTSRFANQGVLNGGSVQKIRSLIVSDYQIDVNTILDRDLAVSTLKKLRVNQSTSITGSGFGFSFARNQKTPVFFVSPNKKAVFNDILLSGFPIEKTSLGAGSQLIFGDKTIITLGENGILNDTWTFSGQAILDGGGNIMELGTGQLLVRPGSSLLLNNITIQNINGSNIRCMDNTSTISLGTMLWTQDGIFTFTRGNIDVIGVTEVAGTSTFVYASNRACRITTFGTFCFDEGMAFSYDPPTNNRTLIQMDDFDATLCFHSASLASSLTGMRLTKGTLIISGHCRVFNIGAKALSQGITFGDGITADDLTIRYLAQGKLDINSGVLVHNQQ